jgi:hypothetical protein
MRRGFRAAVPAGLGVSAFLALFGSRNGILWAIGIGAFVYFKAIRTDRVLVWLRRFHQDERGRLRFSTILRRACFGVCVPITLQDSSFKTSYMIGGSALILLYPLLIPILFLPPILAFALTAWTVGFQSSVGVAAGSVAAVFALVFTVVFVARSVVRLGYTTLDARKAMAALERLLGAIRRRKGPGAGVVVLKCEDQSWQQVVTSALQKADVALLDISERSANVLWELRLASATLPVTSIILACRSEDDERQQLPLSIAQWVREAVGTDAAAKLRVFLYPARNPPIGPQRALVYQQTTEALGDVVLAAASTSSRAAQGAPERRSIVTDHVLILVSLVCATFTLVVGIFGPYHDLRNVLEALAASTVLGLLISIPVFISLWWRRRRRLGVHTG